jgi:hypothetical protein
MWKRWKTPLLLLTLFAALGVMTRELPECLSLSDDISNDGDVPVLCQKELLERVLVFETRASVSPACLALSFEQKPYNSPAATRGAPSLKSARSLLLLLHVQRK